MAWNEPGGGDRDPWTGKGKDQGPPDLDEVVKNLQNKLGGLFGGGKPKDGGGDSGSGMPSKGIFIIVIAILVIGLAFNSFYIIQPAERGVITRLGAYLETVGSGPHLLIPLVDEVKIIDVDNVNKFSHRAQMLTADENIVDLTLTIQYVIQDAADYFFQDAQPEQSIHSAMESALRETAGKSKLDDIITDNRSGVSDDIKTGTQELLDLYRTGLIITNVNIQDANPPEAVQDAFDDATKAREDKERAQNRAEAYANDIVPRARGGAARQVEEAKAYQAQIIAQAKGESSRFLALLKEYEAAPGVTRERLYVEAVQSVLSKNSKVMLDVEKGSNLTYLPLDKMIKPGVRPETSSMPQIKAPVVSSSSSLNNNSVQEASSRSRRSR